MASTCIFCLGIQGFETVEHIIPQSLGNMHYILPRGTICHSCNNRFARFENKVVSSHIFLEERERLGLIRATGDIESDPLRNEDMVKLLLKMGFEGLYASRRTVWERYEWKEIREHLMLGKNWDIFHETDRCHGKEFSSIPGIIDRFRLRSNSLSLDYKLCHEAVYIRFQFGRLRSQIRMV